MLTSYTSSEKENIPYIRKFVKNIKNNDGGAKLFKDTADYHACWSPCKLWENRPQVPDLVWSLNPLERFYYSFIQHNEGLENKLTRTLLLGLAKSIYYWEMFLSLLPRDVCDENSSLN